MTLRDVVESLGASDRNHTIFLDRSAELKPETRAVVACIPEDDSHPAEAEGMAIFIDVWHAREVIAGKARLANIADPTDDQKVDLLIEFAKSGA